MDIVVLVVVGIIAVIEGRWAGTLSPGTASYVHEVWEVRERVGGTEGCGAVDGRGKKKHSATHNVCFQVKGEKYETIFANRSPLAKHYNRNRRV